MRACLCVLPKWMSIVWFLHCLDYCLIDSGQTDRCHRQLNFLSVCSSTGLTWRWWWHRGRRAAGMTPRWWQTASPRKQGSAGMRRRLLPSSLALSSEQAGRLWRQQGKNQWKWLEEFPRLVFVDWSTRGTLVCLHSDGQTRLAHLRSSPGEDLSGGVSFSLGGVIFGFDQKHQANSHHINYSDKVKKENIIFAKMLHWLIPRNSSR